MGVNGLWRSRVESPVRFQYSTITGIIIAVERNDDHIALTINQGLDTIRRVSIVERSSLVLPTIDYSIGDLTRLSENRTLVQFSVITVNSIINIAIASKIINNKLSEQ